MRLISLCAIGPRWLLYICLLVPHTALFNIGVFNVGLWSLLYVFILGAQVWYFWYITVQVLNIDSAQAAVLVAIDFVLFYLIIFVVGAVFRG